MSENSFIPPSGKDGALLALMDLIAIAGAVFGLLELFSTFVHVVEMQNNTRNLLLGIGGPAAAPQYASMLFVDWISYVLGSSVVTMALGLYALFCVRRKSALAAKLHPAARTLVVIAAIGFLLAGSANLLISMTSDLPRLL